MKGKLESGKYMGVKLGVNQQALLKAMETKLKLSPDEVVRKALECYATANGIKIEYTTDLRDLKSRIRNYYTLSRNTDDAEIVDFRFKSISNLSGTALRKVLKLFISEIYEVKLNRVDEILDVLNISYTTLGKVIISEYDKLTLPSNIIRLEIYNG